MHQKNTPFEQGYRDIALKNTPLKLGYRDIAPKNTPFELVYRGIAPKNTLFELGYRGIVLKNHFICAISSRPCTKKTLCFKAMLSRPCTQKPTYFQRCYRGTAPMKTFLEYCVRFPDPEPKSTPFPFPALRSRSYLGNHEMTFLFFKSWKQPDLKYIFLNQKFDSVHICLHLDKKVQFA